MTIRSSSSSGIPFGGTSGRPANAANGQPYFNGDVGRLELYTAETGWQNIVQETPGIASATGAYNESTGSGTFTISGTNFVSGGIAYAIGTNGVEVAATTSTYNSIVQMTAVFANLSADYEPYDIKVVNPSNLFGLLPDAFYINQNPTWTTSSGKIGEIGSTGAVSVSVAGTDPESTSLTYSSSNLPSWLSLNSSTGVLTGTAPTVTSDTTYSFNISISDGINTAVSRSFSYDVLANNGTSALRAFPSTTAAQTLGVSAGTYYFKGGSMSSAVQLYYSGSNYADSSSFVRVFSAPFASTPTVNFVNSSIPFSKFFVRRNDGAYSALVRFNSNQVYNSGGGNLNGASGTNNFSQTAGTRVIIGSAGGHGIYNTNQSTCSWSDSTGSLGAGFDGSCGSYPNELRWGVGNPGQSNYNSMSGTYEHWISW